MSIQDGNDDSLTTAERGFIDKPCLSYADFTICTPSERLTLTKHAAKMRKVEKDENIKHYIDTVSYCPPYIYANIIFNGLGTSVKPEIPRQSNHRSFKAV